MWLKNVLKICLRNELMLFANGYSLIGGHIQYFINTVWSHAHFINREREAQDEILLHYTPVTFTARKCSNSPSRTSHFYHTALVCCLGIWRIQRKLYRQFQFMFHKVFLFCFALDDTNSFLLPCLCCIGCCLCFLQLCYCTDTGSPLKCDHDTIKFA